jgi:hypothetical protein
VSEEPTGRRDEGDDSVIRETTYKLPATREEAPATEALRAHLRDVNAQTVMMNQSNSEQVTGERVVMERSGARSIDAKSAQLDRSGVVALGADHTVLLRSGAVQIVAEEARLNRSQALFLSTERAEIENSRIVFFAGTTEGDIRPMLTPQTAAIAGAAAGLVLLLLGGLLRAVFGRN